MATCIQDVMIKRLGFTVGRKLMRLKSCQVMMTVSFRFNLPRRCFSVDHMIIRLGLGISNKWFRESTKETVCFTKMLNLKNTKCTTMLPSRTRKRNCRPRRNKRNKQSQTLQIHQTPLTRLPEN